MQVQYAKIKFLANNRKISAPIGVDKATKFKTFAYIFLKKGIK